MIKRIVVGAFQANCYLFSLGAGKCMVVDPGANPEKIIQTLDQERLTPTWIVCTHGHFDHVGAISPLIQHFKTKGVAIQLAASRLDAHYFGVQGQTAFEESAEALYLPSSITNEFSLPPQPDLLLEDGEILPFAPFQILSTPGHTPGGICLYNDKDNILFSGDTLFTPGMGRTDMPGGSYVELLTSLEKLFQLPEDTQVYPGHGEVATLGWIRPFLS